MNNSFIQTYSGRKFDFNNPDPDSICIEDIAHSLSQICRFGGHTNRFYSVADHSVNVARLVAWEGHSVSTIQAALLHDTSESYTCDMVTPLKKMFPEFQKLEKKISVMIHHKFNSYLTDVDVAAIKLADQILLVAEAKELFDQPPIENWTDRFPTIPPYVWLHISKTPKEAEYYFLAAANLLLDEPTWNDAQKELPALGKLCEIETSISANIPWPKNRAVLVRRGGTGEYVWAREDNQEIAVSDVRKWRPV